MTNRSKKSSLKTICSGFFAFFNKGGNRIIPPSSTPPPSSANWMLQVQSSRWFEWKISAAKKLMRNEKIWKFECRAAWNYAILMFRAFNLWRTTNEFHLLHLFPSSFDATIMFFGKFFSFHSKIQLGAPKNGCLIDVKLEFFPLSLPLTSKHVF